MKAVDLDMSKQGGTGPQMSSATVAEFFNVFRFVNKFYFVFTNSVQGHDWPGSTERGQLDGL